MWRVVAAAATLASLVCALGCHPEPVIGGTKQRVGGTISGVVSATGNSAPLPGRKVTATNVSTNGQFDTTTAANGGYTMQVPAGTYRLDVELRANEAFAKRPDDVHIDNGDIDARRDFVITVKR